MSDTKKTTKDKAVEAGAKTPQDRLVRAEAEQSTISADFRGVHIEVAPDVMDDYDAVSALTKGLPDPMLELLVPDPDDRATLIGTCRGEDGRARLSAVIEMVGDLMGALGAGN